MELTFKNIWQFWNQYIESETIIKNIFYLEIVFEF